MIRFREFILDEGILSSLKKSFTASSRRAALKSKIDSKMDDQQKKVIGRKVNGDASKAENIKLAGDKRYSDLNKRRVNIEPDFNSRNRYLGRKTNEETIIEVKDYNEFKQKRDEIEKRLKTHSDALNKYPKNHLGMTSDEDKAKPEWKHHYHEGQKALKDLQTHNKTHLKRFKNEHRAELEAKRRT